MVPPLGLLGTVAGILQTFSSINGPVSPERIIQLYGPAITATGSGIFMALVNILPAWFVLAGRDLIVVLAGGVLLKRRIRLHDSTTQTQRYPILHPTH